MAAWNELVTEFERQPTADATLAWLRNKQVETLKKTAQYAGDEDPYVKPRVIEED